MGDWRLEFAKNCVKAVLPFKDQLRALKASVSSSHVSDYHLAVIEGAVTQVETLRRVGCDPRGKLAMEMGSGWRPIMPLIYRLAGAEHVWLSDVERLLHARPLEATVAFMRTHRERIIAALSIMPEQFDKVLGGEIGGELDAMLGQLGLSYIQVKDGWNEAPPVDIIFSHTTLEHIPPPVLSDIFMEARRVLRPGGVMCHGVDHTDHRANVDASLSRIDFLRYSDDMWRLLCVNQLDYTNRLRHSDYVPLFKNAGYDLLWEEPTANDKMAADAKTLPLWGRFKTMSEQDAATAWSLYIARPVAAA